MTTVADLLVARAEDDHLGLRFEDEVWTWRQVVAHVLARARMLRDLRRDGPFHVGVLLENVPEYLFSWEGRHWPAPLSSASTPPDEGPSWRATWRTATASSSSPTPPSGPSSTASTRGSEPARVLSCDAPDYPPRHRDASGPDHDGGPSGAVSLATEIDPATLYLLLFTSGSTGAPKAVRASQGRMAGQASVMAGGSGFGPGDVMYCAMPMFHGNALNTCVVPAIAAGAELVLRRRFSASGFLPDVRRYGVTYFNYVGRALAYVLATPAAPDDADNTLPVRFRHGRLPLRTSRPSNDASDVRSSRATDRARAPSPCHGDRARPARPWGSRPPGPTW